MKTMVASNAVRARPKTTANGRHGDGWRRVWRAWASGEA
jgi:hypothetical protein